MELNKILIFVKKNFSHDQYLGISDCLYISLNSKNILQKYKIFKSKFYNLTFSNIDYKKIYALSLYLANLNHLYESYFVIKFLKGNNLDVAFISEIFLNTGKIFQKLGKYDLAILYLHKSKNLNNNDFRIHLNLGLVYQKKGHIEKAKDFFCTSFKLNDYCVEGHRQYSLSHKYTNEKDEHLLKMLELAKLFDKNLISENEKSQILFSIGKAYEDIKNYKKAFNFFQDANFLRRKNIKFNSNFIASQFKTMKNILRICKNQKLPQIKNLSEKKIIFIVGMPRSGTTLLEQVISSHSKIVSLGETLNFPKAIKKFFPESDLINFEKSFHNLSNDTITKFISYINEIYTINKKNINKGKKDYIAVTDKLPFNFIFIGLINFFIPSAKIINILRSPPDNCLSIFKNYFQGNQLGFAYDQKELSEYYINYKDLINFYRENHLNFINVHYESLIKNLEKESRKIFEYLEIDFEKACLQFYNNKNIVSSLSINQVRKKTYTSSINSWKHYEEYISGDIKNLK